MTPPGGRILDPFAGSGTTGQAAALEGLSAVLCEMEPQYHADIRRRIDMMKMGNDEKRVVAIKARGRADDHAGPLFDLLGTCGVAELAKIAVDFESDITVTFREIAS